LLSSFKDHSVIFCYQKRKRLGWQDNLSGCAWL